MFDTNGSKMIVLLLLVFFIIGPERLPGYAEQLKEVVNKAQRYASDAKEGLVETLGSEVAEVDRKKLDPRQYAPRTIVCQALLEDDSDPDHGPGREEQHRVEEERALREQLEHKRLQREQEALAAVPTAKPVDQLPTEPQNLDPADAAERRLVVARRGAGTSFDAETT